jgi:hypothetical protein
MGDISIIPLISDFIRYVKTKLSLQQAVEVYRVERC